MGYWTIPPSLALGEGRILLFTDDLLSLANEGLGQLETQDRGIKPIEAGALVASLVNQRIKEVILAALFVTKNKLLVTLVQNKLLLRSFHSQP